MTEVEKLAFDLPVDQRALPVQHLLATLSPVLQDEDEDEDEAEAARRDVEMDANPHQV